MEQTSEVLNQSITLNRENRWITGIHAGDVYTSTITVDGTRKSRTWWRGPKPWTATKPYTVSRFRQWPQSYFISMNEVLYGIGEEEGQTFVSPDGILQICGNISSGNGEAEAMNECLRIIGGAKWLAPVFLSELDKAGESIERLGTVFRGGHRIMANALSSRPYRRQCYSDMRRFLTWHGFGRFIPRLWGTMTDAWLAWRYSVATAALDAKDAAKAAAEVMRDTPRVTENAHAHRVVNLTTVSGSTGEGPLRSGHITTLYNRSDYSYTSYAKCEAWITAVRQYNPPLAQAAALGALNLPASLWEMIPGSFIADWALNLGDYLELQNSLVGWSVVDSGSSVLRYVSGETQGVIASWAPWTIDIMSDIPPVAFEASIYNRAAWVAPTPTWLPAFKMTTERWLDAIALCRGLPGLSLRK